MREESVWAVVTSYRPDPGLLLALDALRDQVAAIVVVDDGSGSPASAVLEGAEQSGAHIIRLADNRGISVALNTGIQAALDGGADSVVTFDQDSVVQPGFVASLLATRDAARAGGHAIGPVVPEYFAEVSQVHREAADGTLIARHAIQSGMLLDRGLLADVGLMRADLFIDLVDTEFELRAADAGRTSIASPGLRLAHSLGHRYVRMMFGRPVRVPGIPPVVTLSTPFRYYYRVRNRLVVNGLHGRRHLGWVVRDTILEVLHYGNALVLARPRRDLWRIYRAAVRDARRGRMGRMPADLQSAAAAISWAAPSAD